MSRHSSTRQRYDRSTNAQRQQQRAGRAREGLLQRISGMALGVACREEPLAQHPYRDPDLLCCGGDGHHPTRAGRLAEGFLLILGVGSSQVHAGEASLVVHSRDPGGAHPCVHLVPLFVCRVCGASRLLVQLYKVFQVPHCWDDAKALAEFTPSRCWHALAGLDGHGVKRNRVQQISNTKTRTGVG